MTAMKESGFCDEYKMLLIISQATAESLAGPGENKDHSLGKLLSLLQLAQSLTSSFLFS